MNVREARRRAPAPAVDDATAALLQAGKLEQTCPACGRTEAAGGFCSWCARRMSAADWYRNDDRAERLSRPTGAPGNPPSEFLNSEADWPPEWGEYPRQRPPRSRPSHITAASDPVAVSVPTGTLGL